MHLHHRSSAAKHRGVNSPSHSYDTGNRHVPTAYLTQVVVVAMKINKVKGVADPRTLCLCQLIYDGSTDL